MNICAFKIKYLEKGWREEIKENVTSVKNKVIALSNLEENSSGSALMKKIEQNSCLMRKLEKI